MRFQYLNKVVSPISYMSEKHKIKKNLTVDYDHITDTYIAYSNLGSDDKSASIYNFKFTGLYNPDGTPQVEYEEKSLDLIGVNKIESICRDPKGDGFLPTATAQKNFNDSYQLKNKIQSSTRSSNGDFYVLLEQNLVTDISECLRIIKFNVTGKEVAQYAYFIDHPLSKATEILAINDDKLLVLEKGNDKEQASSRIYELNLKNTQDVTDISNLISENIKENSKKLVFDSTDSFTTNIDNITQNNFDNVQGMSLGPLLSDGRSSLVLVSDTNDTQKRDIAYITSFALQSENYDTLQLHYLNQVQVPVGYIYVDPSNNKSYIIGGLSGIDYDPATDTYIVVSDHQPDTGDSVMYRFKLTGLTDTNSQPQVHFLSAQSLDNELGGKIHDAESIRYDPNGDGFWVTTEESTAGIYHYHSDGTISTIAVPTNIATRAQYNLSLEGATFAPDGSYYVSMERNLKDDATGYSRITKYDANGNIAAQYAYYTDKPSSIDATGNGISEILALDNNTLLVMERGHNSNQENVTQGVASSRVRIYKVSLVGAQNVLNIDYLTANNTTTMTKDLVFNSMDPVIANQLNTNQTKIDNVEGMTLGPRLADGRQSLILVTDNNFNQAQYKTQFLSLVLDDGEPCFLAGTFIHTQQGMVRVEDIVPGDLIYSLGRNNIWQLRQVIWTGKQTTTVSAYKHDDLAGYPVCIRRNAFEEGVPFADLYVTAEHCMFFDDCFVPIRMLVNGKTIIYDRSFATYDYYHIELEKHSIIMANGALSESYLDTGNKHYFISKKPYNSGTTRIKSWDRDAAAPIITKRKSADLIFKFLDKRADEMQVQSVEPKKERTKDPSLYLITDKGEKIFPVSVIDSKVSFKLHSTIKSVRLISKTYRPCDVWGPYIDNRHVVGVLIGKIIIHQGKQQYIIDNHLSGVDLSGWLPQTQSHARWTSGNALIPLKIMESNTNMFLSIQVVETGSYELDA